MFSANSMPTAVCLTEPLQTWAFPLTTFYWREKAWKNARTCLMVMMKLCWERELMSAEPAKSPENEPPKRDAFTIDLSQAKSQPFPEQDDEYRISIGKEVHANILAHAATNPNIELCGVLVGNLCHDETGPFLLITDIVRGKEAREEASNVTFTHSTWEHIHKEMDAKHADSRIVGWYHMHPGFGVFLSEVDIFAHTHFFNAAWQVALVVDPKAQSEGFFHWRNGQVVRSRRYWVGDETRWVPAQRPATGIPPGTSQTTPGKPGFQQNPDRPVANQATRAGGDSYGWQDLLTIGLPIVLCLFLLFLNVRGSLVNSQLGAEVHKLEREINTSNNRLAQETALWLRQRLDNGANPNIILPLYERLLKLDPDRKNFYAALLPEFDNPQFQPIVIKKTAKKTPPKKTTAIKTAADKTTVKKTASQRKTDK
jgi:proteasome lid subunit RPN8/RPN11